MGTGARGAECKEFSRQAVVLREGVIDKLSYQGNWYQSVDCRVQSILSVTSVAIDVEVKTRVVSG
jgi:hypothetical protein